MIILTLILLAILGNLLNCFIKYQKVKANAFSKEEVKRAANEQARRIKYKDPIISCDYCGSKVDTSKFKTCPHCGGAYDQDVEWLNRFNVKDSFIESSTQNIIYAREKKSIEEQKKAKKNLTVAELLLLAYFVICGVGAVAADFLMTESKYQKTKDVNDGEYHDFIKEDYGIDGDGVLYDDGNIKVSVTGIYKGELAYSSSDENLYKVEIHVENHSDKNIRVMLECNSINGVSYDSGQFYIIEKFKKNSDVYTYAKSYYILQDSISELVFDVVDIKDIDYNDIGGGKGPVVVNTTAAPYREFEPYLDSKLVFSNDQADIYAAFNPDKDNSDKYCFYIKNKTDHYFTVSSEKFKIDSVPVDSYGLTKEFLYNKYWLYAHNLHPSSDDYKDLSGKTVEISFSLTCLDDPSLSFATPYLDISPSVLQ